MEVSENTESVQRDLNRVILNLTKTENNYVNTTERIL